MLRTEPAGPCPVHWRPLLWPWQRALAGAGGSFDELITRNPCRIKGSGKEPERMNGRRVQGDTKSEA
ncbi:hypothetical protein GCM10010255_16850 [Streptomyces coeruleofuscus]|uniref:Uncharacterized protein n=1 Tax=Streptomyces coeruleofuscus TaxID=66879 RepID=A0ABN3HWS6_9ACTN